ncbi:MAG: hypothetical protein ACEPOZ_20885 [Marinifilaceae bacterium]
MIYKFRILSEENENFVREIEIDAEQTFLDLHNCIQNSTKYDSSQMASFYVIGNDGLRGKEIALFEMNTEEDDNMNVVAMDVAMIREFASKEEPVLTYVFDFFSDRYFTLELVETRRGGRAQDYPKVLLAEGDAPEQIVMNAENFDDLDLGDINLNPKAKTSEYDFLDEFDDDTEDNGPSFESLDDYEDIL